MENFMKNEFNDSTNMVYHHDLTFQNCKKKLNFTNANNNVASNNLIKLPIKHDIPVQNNCFQYKPSNTKRNERERKRVKTINDYFAKLQKFLPNSKQTTKKLSKVETLKAAIDYIEYLQINSKNNQLNVNNGLTICNPPKVQKESRNKLLNKLNTASNNNIENTNSSISSSSSSSSSSSTISTSSCYSTPTVSPLQISHNNSSNNNILNNNTNNSNIQVHVNINSNNLQVPPQHSTYQHYQAPQQTLTACATEQQTMIQYPNRTPTKSYYNNTSSTPSSPNNHGNYYPLDESGCYASKNVLPILNENYNNNIQMYHQQNIMNNNHYPAQINNTSTEFMHQNSYYNHQQQQQHQINRISTTSTPKRNLDLTSYSTDDGIDTVNSSTISNSNDDYTPSIYSTSSQHLVPPENTEICSRNQNYNNNNVKTECFLTDNLLLDFM
jgi:hypothetical protein